MKTLAVLALVLAATNVDKPFVSGGSINVQLSGGEYEIVPSADNHIRVLLSGNVGTTVTDVAISKSHADIKVSNTPSHGDFHATIEVPKTSDLLVRMTAGDLTVGSITGNKDVASNAGDVKIAVGSSVDYGSVDASVKVGDLSAGPFDGKKEGLIGQSLNWTGKGKYTLHAHLLAGDLKLR